jgi:hypothetical protein
MQLSAIAESPRARSIAYAGLTAALFLAAVGMGAAKAEILRQPFDLVVSDGRFYYAYLLSLILDHDFDFTNQIAFLLGHLLELVSAASIPADGYSWPNQLACLALIKAIVW